MCDPTGTGTIKINDLYVIALINALPDKDKIFAENTAFPTSSRRSRRCQTLTTIR